MRAIFSIRGLLFIWIVITGSIALISHLHGMATELRNSMQASANFITGIYNWINGGAASLGDAILGYFNVKPDKLWIDIREPVTIQVTWQYGLLLMGLLLLIPAVWIYWRAIKSKEFADDFIALLFFYVFIVTGLSIALGLGFQVAATVQRGWVLLAFAVIILLLSIFEGALTDSKLFFRGLLEIGLLALFLFPQETMITAAFLLDGLANVASSLGQSVNGFVFWAIVAILMALGQLYGIGAPKPKEKGDHLGQVIGDLEGVAGAARKGHGKKSEK